jgi:hypothetical protein
MGYASIEAEVDFTFALEELSSSSGMNSTNNGLCHIVLRDI